MAPLSRFINATFPDIMQSNQSVCERVAFVNLCYIDVQKEFNLSLKMLVTMTLFRVCIRSLKNVL